METTERKLESMDDHINDNVFKWWLILCAHQMNGTKNCLLQCLQHFQTFMIVASRSYCHKIYFRKYENGAAYNMQHRLTLHAFALETEEEGARIVPSIEMQQMILTLSIRLSK